MQRRLIPACAGKTSPPAKKTSSSPAHPRVCGENALGGQYVFGDMGSSPRVRGKQRLRTRRASGVRLIPACAGKTVEEGEYLFAAPAHPRVCGENPTDATTALDPAGSSPRVRGKHDVGEINPSFSGLIPACAGKTEGGGGVSRRGPAHPRVCGENGLVCLVGNVAKGSSPRVRGKPPPPHSVA